MEAVLVGVAIASVFAIKFPDALPERVRGRAILAAGFLGGAGFGWVAWTNDAWPPLMMAIAMPVAAALSYRHQWGPPARLEQEARHRDSLADSQEVVRGPARLLRGWTVFGSKRGWLELRESRLRFVLESGEQVFDIDVRQQHDLSFRLWKRGQLRLRLAGQTYKLMFGHSLWMDLEEQRRAIEFWKFAVQSRNSAA